MARSLNRLAQVGAARDGVPVVFRINFGDGLKPEY